MLALQFFTIKFLQSFFQVFFAQGYAAEIGVELGVGNAIGRPSQAQSPVRHAGQQFRRRLGALDEGLIGRDYVHPERADRRGDILPEKTQQPEAAAAAGGGA